MSGWPSNRVWFWISLRAKGKRAALANGSLDVRPIIGSLAESWDGERRIETDAKNNACSSKMSSDHRDFFAKRIVIETEAQ